MLGVGLIVFGGWGGGVDALLRVDGYAGSWANCFWWGRGVDALLRVDGYAGSWANCFWWGGG